MTDSLITRLFQRFDPRGPLHAADRPRWAAAEDLPDVAELTAQWLEGTIRSQPGYYGQVDVDEQDAPGLTAALITCNRAGFPTRDSQAGCAGQTTSYGHWVQLAAVTGFADCDVADRVHAAVKADGRFRMIPDFDLDDDLNDGVVITWCDGRPYTRYARLCDEGTIRNEFYDGVSDAAVRDILWSLEVTVYDPVPGRNDLWAFLGQTLNP